MNFQSLLTVLLIFLCTSTIKIPLLAAADREGEGSDSRQIRVKRGEQQPPWMDSWKYAREAKNSGDLETAKKDIKHFSWKKQI